VNKPASGFASRVVRDAAMLPDVRKACGLLGSTLKVLGYAQFLRAQPEYL